MEMTREEYKSKREEVIAKFTPEFIERNFRKDAMLNAILEMLIRDKSPYEMIEIMIDERVKTMAEFQKYVEMFGSPMTYRYEK